MKEIKPPNLLLEKIRSIHKRKADFRPHRPSFQQQQSFPASNGYDSPLPPAPVPANNGYGSPVSDPISSSGGYDAPEEGEQEEIDLHNKEFCVDVSTYQPVLWVERDGQECKTSWVKQCEDKTENVCIDVTETVCEVS